MSEAWRCPAVYGLKGGRRCPKHGIMVVSHYEVVSGHASIGSDAVWACPHPACSRWAPMKASVNGALDPPNRTASSQRAKRDRLIVSRWRNRGTVAGVAETFGLSYGRVSRIIRASGAVRKKRKKAKRAKAPKAKKAPKRFELVGEKKYIRVRLA